MLHPNGFGPLSLRAKNIRAPSEDLNRTNLHAGTGKDNAAPGREGPVGGDPGARGDERGGGSRLGGAGRGVGDGAGAGIRAAIGGRGIPGSGSEIWGNRAASPSR